MNDDSTFTVDDHIMVLSFKLLYILLLLLLLLDL